MLCAVRIPVEIAQCIRTEARSRCGYWLSPLDQLLSNPARYNLLRTKHLQPLMIILRHRGAVQDIQYVALLVRLPR